MQDSLLFALSSLGEVNVQKFDHVCGWLLLVAGRYEDEQVGYNFVRTQTLRFLDALGHCEYDFKNRRIQICRPGLVTVPSSGLQKLILTGARTPRLLRELKRFQKQHTSKMSVSILTQHHKSLLVPSAVVLESVSLDTVHECADLLEIRLLEKPATWLLLNYSATCSEYERILEFKSIPEPNWAKRVFDATSLLFRYNSDSEEIAKLLEYVHPITQQRLHFLWNNGSLAEVDRDWGRFIVLNKLGKKVLYYDSHRHILALPARVPLPRIIARAVTLCAGIVPARGFLNDRTDGVTPAPVLHFYKSVPPPIAKVVALKLGQELIPRNLELEVTGVDYD